MYVSANLTIIIRNRIKYNYIIYLYDHDSITNDLQYYSQWGGSDKRSSRAKTEYKVWRKTTNNKIFPFE